MKTTKNTNDHEDIMAILELNVIAKEIYEMDIVCKQKHLEVKNSGKSTTQGR
jgi:hypothetical protein